MADCYLHDKKLSSIFQLIGEKENDITCGLGWVLSNSEIFLSLLLEKLNIKYTLKPYDIFLQKYDDENNNVSITDIEISTPDSHIIIEAKKGWMLPSNQQILKYTQKIKGTKKRYKVILSLSECSMEYANYCLPSNELLQHLPWTTLYEMLNAAIVSSKSKEKRLLTEYKLYLKEIITMQNKESNWVYVVSLGKSTPSGWWISWRNIVNEKSKYFHPSSGNGWPTVPPNYIAFRYDGKLQSIHHIEKYIVTRYMNDEIQEIPRKKEEPHFIYTLGRPIKPNKEIGSGNIRRSTRVWCMFDTLLTADTISDACDISKQRMR